MKAKNKFHGKIIKTSCWELPSFALYAIAFLGRHYFLLENISLQIKKNTLQEVMTIQRDTRKWETEYKFIKNNFSQVGTDKSSVEKYYHGFLQSCIYLAKSTQTLKCEYLTPEVPGHC